MKSLLFLCCLLGINAHCMLPNQEESVYTPITGKQPIKQYSRRSSLNPSEQAPIVYVPKSVDVSRQLRTESRCCFCAARWILQPINVVSSLASFGLVALGEYYIDSRPQTAFILNGIGLACGLTNFISNVLTLKINNKLESIDEYFEEKGTPEVS